MTIASTWQDILAAPRGEIDLAQAALVIAGDEYPELDVAAYVARIDALAQALRQRLRADITPADTLPLRLKS